MPQFQRIVCPTDFSPPGEAAAKYAASLARAYHGKLLLLHVLPQLHYPLRGLGMTAIPHLQADLHERAKDRLRQLATSLGEGFELQLELRDGEPFEQIIAAAREANADIIVMGTHGHRGLKHALVGSTAERVVRMAGCPVLTVRHPV